jgi:hypothetical protein
VLPQVALSLLCKSKIYINFQLAASGAHSAFSHCIRTSEPGLPDSYKSPYTKPLPSVCYPYFSGLKDSQELLRSVLHTPCPLSEPKFTELENFQNGIRIYSVNPENKYNRTLGKAFVDGHFYAFAVNSDNSDSDKRNTISHPFHIGGTQ